MATLSTLQKKLGFRPDKLARARYCSTMSAAEIIDELPKLSEADLRLVRQRFVELAAKNEDVGLCDQTALDGASMLDRMEEEDALRQSR